MAIVSLYSNKIPFFSFFRYILVERQFLEQLSSLQKKIIIQNANYLNGNCEPRNNTGLKTKLD